MILPIVISGPTGSNKSIIALKLAKYLSGEIICVDSCQIYKNARILSASPHVLDLKQITHYSYNFVNFNENFNIVEFIKICHMNIISIIKNNNLPILVGGSVLYCKFLRTNYVYISFVQKIIKRIISLFILKKGSNFLYNILNKYKFHYIDSTLSNDSYRISRDFSMYVLYKYIVNLHYSYGIVKNMHLRANWILLYPNLAWLKLNLINRIDHMFDNGLVEEVIELKHKFRYNNKLFSLIGYREILLVINNHISIKEAKSIILVKHMNYAKYQLMWLKKECWWHTFNPLERNVVKHIIDSLI